jgi:hypothetical protein
MELNKAEKNIPEIKTKNIYSDNELRQLCGSNVSLTGKAMPLVKLAPYLTLDNEIIIYVTFHDKNVDDWPEEYLYKRVEVRGVLEWIPRTPHKDGEIVQEIVGPGYYMLRVDSMRMLDQPNTQNRDKLRDIESNFDRTKP